MKIKLSKYIARLLSQNGITQCFSVVGGGAMHLNDGFGHEPGIHTLYMHHEQSCAMAAESYGRIYNKPAICCVTTGPGGTNAITGVVGAWTDSIPMIVISGQVRYDNTARWSGTGIRVMGDQEFDIIRAVDCMTKYAKLVLDPKSIRYEVEKALYLSQTGRPGPVWLDIPVDIQGMQVEESDLYPFDIEAFEKETESMLDFIDEAEEKAEKNKSDNIYSKADLNDPLLNVSFLKQKWQTAPEHITKDSPVVMKIIKEIEKSERPVFYTGNGIRIAGAEDIFLKVADKLAIPVVVGWNGQDIIPSEHPLKAGQPGGRGDRPGNFAVQNSDLILSIGSRLSIRQVGYNFATWARKAYVICCDIDEEELKKPSVHINLPVHADAYELLKALDEKLTELGFKGHGKYYNNLAEIKKDGYYDDERFLFRGGIAKNGLNWWQMIEHWNEKYPVYLPKFKTGNVGKQANMYEFYNKLGNMVSDNTITVVGNGSADVACGVIYKIKEGSRFISQDGIASMGYDLPAAIGACAACHDVSGRLPEKGQVKGLIDNKAYAYGELEEARKNPHWKGRHEYYPPLYANDVICITGDGSIMMNLQELETIKSHEMPIKIFMVNNNGYHSIRQTQVNLFNGEPLTGIGGDSADLSFPDFRKVARAFNLSYTAAASNDELEDAIRETLEKEGPAFCEIFCDTEQFFEPKSAVKKAPDGSLSSPPLEDMAPFLSKEELEEEMIITEE
ncbi:MAG: thiamine pyrophosphate-binding protein [Eubacteriales bacterium]|nr:thiamine pyrophosphate-binding protein [Eubacteriales bacterium]